MDIYKHYGIKTIINAAGTLTRLGGSRPLPEVMKAMSEAAIKFALIEDLQAAASDRIAALTGAEAGIVTCGAAAALTLATAACLARLDPEKIANLPNTNALNKNEVLLAQTHRTGYETAIRAAGAKLTFLNASKQAVDTYEKGINDKTAAVFYSAEGPEYGLTSICAFAREKGIPVIVDAAAEIPPEQNLRRFISAGASLVAFSGGKALRGPQNSGILAGEKDLIASALLQNMDLGADWELWNPPESLFAPNRLPRLHTNGIGRGLKVSKETIIGLLAALECLNPKREKEMISRWRHLAEILMENLAALSEWRVSIGTARHTRPAVPVVLLQSRKENAASQAAKELILGLRKGNPSIFTDDYGWRDGEIVLNPICLEKHELQPIVKRIHQLTR